MSNDLTVLIPWVIAHGYSLIFLFGVLEGPFMAIAAGAAVGLGYFNIYIIIILAYLSDTVGDIMYYGLGYLGSYFNKFTFFKWLMAKRKVGDIKKLLLHHTAKSVVIMKLAPGVGFLGLIVLGSIHAPFKKFLKVAFLVSVPKSIFFVLCGYWFGWTYRQLSKSIAQGQYIVLGILFLLVLIYFIYLKIIKKIVKKLELEN